MTTSETAIQAETREGLGKGASRRARREGYIPGIVYGGGENPTPIQLRFNDLLKRLQAGRFLSKLHRLEIGGLPEAQVICRGVQRDVVRNLPTHVDFMRLKKASKVNLFIPVRFMNEDQSPGLKRGGVLTVVRGEVELIVTAGEIPDELTADLSGKDIGDVITISQIQLPAGASLTITERDFVIANISAPSGLRSSEEEEEDAAAVPAIADEGEEEEAD